MPVDSRILMSAAIAAVLAAGTTQAQSQTSDTTEQTEQSGQIANDLSLGEADTGPRVGEPYVAEQVGPWAIRCIKTETDNDPCQMVQLLEDEQGSPIAEFSLFRLVDGGQAEAGATIIVPLETALQQQLSIQVDDQQGKRYPFSFCDPVGCHARIGLTAEDVQSYKRGAAAAISIVPIRAPDQRVIVNLSLDGFTASYDKVSSLQPE